MRIPWSAQKLSHAINIDDISAVTNMVCELHLRLFLTDSLIELVDDSALYPEELLYRLICKGEISFGFFRICLLYIYGVCCLVCLFVLLNGYTITC